MVYIYKLIDPISGKVRYIGWTINLQRRLRKHISEARKGVKTHKGDWIRSLINKNKLPHIKVIKQVDNKTWREWEVYYIAKYRRLGYDLVNCTDGGDGMLNPSKEVRLKMSLAKRGITNPATKGGKSKVSIPIIGTCIKTGAKRKFVNAQEAAKILCSEGILANGNSIRQVIRKRATNKGKYIRKSSSGYTWEKC